MKSMLTMKQKKYKRHSCLNQPSDAVEEERIGVKENGLCGMAKPDH